MLPQITDLRLWTLAHYGAPVRCPVRRTLRERRSARRDLRYGAR